MNDDRYFAYIDILGFTELVKDNPEKIERLFRIIDNLHVFKDPHYKAVVFSDTILIHNTKPEEYESLNIGVLMYMIEFITDLLMSTIDMGVHFRAIITKGEFKFKALKNFDSYYGQTLIMTYGYEKKIKAMGIFLDNRLTYQNPTFKSIKYDNHFDFVYPFRELEVLNIFEQSDFPIKEQLYFEGPSNLKAISVYLKNLYDDSNNNDLTWSIREKYVNTYALFRQRHIGLIPFLEANNFNHKVIAANPDWIDDNDGGLYSANISPVE